MDVRRPMHIDPAPHALSPFLYLRHEKRGRKKWSIPCSAVPDRDGYASECFSISFMPSADRISISRFYTYRYIAVYTFSMKP